MTENGRLERTLDVINKLAENKRLANENIVVETRDNVRLMTNPRELVDGGLDNVRELNEIYTWEFVLDFYSPDLSDNEIRDLIKISKSLGVYEKKLLMKLK